MPKHMPNHMEEAPFQNHSRVIDVIKERDLRMRPRWYFTLRAILLGLATAAIFLLLLYTASFIVFTLHKSGAWTAPYFGLPGWQLLLGAIPWGLLILSIALLAVLAYILRRHPFVYSRPFLYFLLVLVVVIDISALVLGTSSLYRSIFEYPSENLPFFGGFYAHESAPPASVHRGTIVAIGNGTSTDGDNGNSFIITDALGVTTSVRAAPGVIFLDEFHVGDVILIFGSINPSGTIRAFGIERLAAATSTGA